MPLISLEQRCCALQWLQCEGTQASADHQVCAAPGAHLSADQLTEPDHGPIELQDHGYQVLGIHAKRTAAGVSEVGGVLDLVEDELDSKWSVVERAVQCAHLIVCELSTHAHVALRLAACAAAHPQRAERCVCIGISSPLVWAKNARFAPLDTPAAPDAVSVSASIGTNSNDGSRPSTASANTSDGARQHPQGDADTAEPQTASSEAEQTAEPLATPPASQPQPWAAAQYRQRLAAPQAQATKLAEDALLQRNTSESVLTYILCPGVLYGRGEHDAGLHHACAMAWQGTESTALDILGSGDNTIPMLHVSDLAASILAVQQTQPAQRYLIVTDGTCLSQKSVIEAVSESFGTGKVAEQPAMAALVSEVCHAGIGKRQTHALLVLPYCTRQCQVVSVLFESSFAL